MTARKLHKEILLGLILCGALLMQSCAAPLLTLPVTTFFSGAELALKGGDIYKQMRKADGRRAFELTFDQTWEHTLKALRDLSLEVDREALNEDGDGGVMEVKSKGGKMHIAVVELNERVCEVGVWAKSDKALAALILAKIQEQNEENETMMLNDE